MGTNYYWIKDACDKCGRGSDRVHIGKSSLGWTFNFHGTEEIRSWKNWREALTDQKIEDEYGRPISLDGLAALINGKSDGISHARIATRSGLTETDQKYMRDHPSDLLVCAGPFGGSWVDAEGHGFSDGEFS